MFLFVLEIMGSIAFAISGAMVAIKKEFDLLGVIVLGITTSIGGGIIRDVILGITPPKTFQNSIYAKVSIVSSVIVFLFVYINRSNMMKREIKVLYEKLLLISDTIGLGVFTVVGINIAYSQLEEPNTFLFIFVGVLTGVGGGLCRDMMAGNKPYIFVKHIYASASIASALTTVYLWEVTNKNIAMMCGIAVVSIIRFLAAHFEWNLPKIKRTEENNNRMMIQK